MLYTKMYTQYIHLEAHEAPELATQTAIFHLFS